MVYSHEKGYIEYILVSKPLLALEINGLKDCLKNKHQCCI